MSLPFSPNSPKPFSVCDRSMSPWPPGHLKSVLSEYVSHLNRVRLVRSARRLGVGGCRSLGAAKAEGEVLVFMDSHCECQKGWLEPLLERVAQDRYFFKCIFPPPFDPPLFTPCQDPWRCAVYSKLCSYYFAIFVHGIRLCIYSEPSWGHKAVQRPSHIFESIPAFLFFTLSPLSCLVNTVSCSSLFHIWLISKTVPTYCKPICLLRSRVVSPIIDVIDWRTFQYNATQWPVRGLFNWRLDFRWELMQDEDPDSAVRALRWVKDDIFIVQSLWYPKM